MVHFDVDVEFLTSSSTPTNSRCAPSSIHSLPSIVTYFCSFLSLSTQARAVSSRIELGLYSVSRYPIYHYPYFCFEAIALADFVLLLLGFLYWVSAMVGRPFGLRFQIRTSHAAFCGKCWVLSLGSCRAYCWGSEFFLRCVNHSM